MELSFVRSEKQEDLKAIFDHNTDAFSDSPDFHWGLQEIKNEIKNNWELYKVSYGEEIIAALFISEIEDILYTKNTGLKMEHQGSGFSHEIKEFYERLASERSLVKIIHYCRIDNFRMYSLNESHGYTKLKGAVDEEGLVVQWSKDLV